MSGISNEEAFTWNEEKNLGTNLDSRRGKNVRREGKTVGNEQERISRTYSEGVARSSYYQEDDGGMFGLLIEDYRKQEVAKSQEIERLNKELTEIRTRIANLEALRGLENSLEE